MKYTLNPIFVLKNPHFRKLVFFDKYKLLGILLISLISICIYNSFPLVTQIYISYLYSQDSIVLLAQITAALIVLFLFKLVMDIIVEKYLNKYFLKFEKNAKELMYEKYSENLRKLVKERSSLFSSHLFLYITLIKTMYYNLLDVIKIIFIMVIMFFFDKSLFRYALFAVPFFILFYLLGRRARLEEDNVSNDKKEKKDNGDFGLFLNSIANSGTDKKEAKQRVKVYLEERFKRKSKDKNKHVALHLSMSSFVGFFRLAYLAYFGYYIITLEIHLSGLIIGLLYITLLIKPCIHLLQSLPYYAICNNSFFKINSLCQK